MSQPTIRLPYYQLTNANNMRDAALQARDLIKSDPCCIGRSYNGVSFIDSETGDERLINWCQIKFLLSRCRVDYYPNINQPEFDLADCDFNCSMPEYIGDQLFQQFNLCITSEVKYIHFYFNPYSVPDRFVIYNGEINTTSHDIDNGTDPVHLILYDSGWVTNIQDLTDQYFTNPLYPDLRPSPPNNRHLINTTSWLAGIKTVIVYGKTDSNVWSIYSIDCFTDEPPFTENDLPSYR